MDSYLVPNRLGWRKAEDQVAHITLAMRPYTSGVVRKLVSTRGILSFASARRHAVLNVTQPTQSSVNVRSRVRAVRINVRRDVMHINANLNKKIDLKLSKSSIYNKKTL